MNPTHMQTPANIQTGAYFHRRAGTPTHKHTWTHRQAYYGGWVQTDCVECGSTPSVYFEGLWANSRFPGSSSAPPIEPAWGVCDGAERSYLGSIIKHPESIYQVVWWDILKFFKSRFSFDYKTDTLGLGGSFTERPLVLHAPQMTFRGQSSSWWLLTQ